MIIIITERKIKFETIWELLLAEVSVPMPGCASLQWANTYNLKDAPFVTSPCGTSFTKVSVITNLNADFPIALSPTSFGINFHWLLGSS